MFYLKFKQWQNIIRGKSQPRFTLLWFSSKFLICLQQKLSRSATWPKYLINASGECGAGRRKQVADSDLPLENSPKTSEYSCWCKPQNNIYLYLGHIFYAQPWIQAKSSLVDWTWNLQRMIFLMGANIEMLRCQIFGLRREAFGSYLLKFNSSRQRRKRKCEI